MAARVLILRPQPGADRTAERARMLGLDPVVAPLFEVRPVAWTAPDPAGFDAVMLTSANAVRHAGPGLLPFLRLPAYAVGDATAEAAREAGFGQVTAGPADAGDLVRMMAEAGVRRAFHPCGADRIAIGPPGFLIERRVVYASEAVSDLPSQAAAALAEEALALLHSPRAGSLFAALCDRASIDQSTISIAALSEAAARAAGSGWRSVLWAREPRDQALLEIATKLCNTMPGRGLDR